MIFSMGAKLHKYVQSTKIMNLFSYFACFFLRIEGKFPIFATEHYWQMKTSFYKNTLLAILTSLFLGATCAWAHTPMRLSEEPLLGDVNHSGEVDISDVLCVVDYILGKPLESFDVTAADLNNSGVIDISDVLLLVDIILGIPTTEEHPNMNVLFPTIE